VTGPGRAPRSGDRRPDRRTILDAGIYAGSALVALGVWLLAGIPIQRTWGRMALGPYASGTLIALALALRGGSSVKLRAWVAAVVFAGSALVPMTLEVTWRAHTFAGLHAQSEVIVTEEAAKALVHGKDPYVVEYLHGPLAARPLGTKTHFPYLPGMVLFGLPRALFGSNGAGDARVWFAVVTLATVGVALRLATGLDLERKLRIAQILLVVPTGAFLMATGGDDLPVVALMLLAVVLAARGKPVGAGLALGLGAALKQTAWVLIPFLVLAMSRRGSGRGGRRAALAVAGPVVAVVLPFVIWDPGAFVEDVVKFPLGLGRQPTAARTATLGSWLVRTFPSARAAITSLLVAVVAGAAVAVVLRLPHGTIDIARAVRGAGWVFAIGVVLAPAGRTGYLVYPVNLLTWSWFLDRAHRQAEAGTGQQAGHANRSEPVPASGGPVETGTPAVGWEG
jgi:Glycosyltransferase family 87